MNYREKIRKAIECPQLNNTRYGEWGAVNLEQRKYIKRLLDELDSADNYLKRVYLENKQLKEIIDKAILNTEEIANNIIRVWKIDFLAFKGNGEITNYGSFEPDFTDVITIPVYDNRKKKNKRIKNPTRAEKKRQTQKLIEV